MTRPRLWRRQARRTGGTRIESRTASISDDVAWLQERHRWPGLVAVGKITASRQEGDHISVETWCYLLNRAFTPERFTCIAREHWGIENRLHWVLDVVFNEDQCRNRKDNCPNNLALLLTRIEPRPSGTLKRLHERQAETGWLGQSLPDHNPDPVHQNPNAIALTGERQSLPRRKRRTITKVAPANQSVLAELAERQASRIHPWFDTLSMNGFSGTLQSSCLAA